MTPLLQHTMAWVRSQLPEPGFRELTDQDRDDASVAARILRGQDGDKLLEIIARASVLRPPTDPRINGDAARDYAQRRTGENAIFGVLVHLLDTHDHLTRKDNAPENLDAPDIRPFGWPEPGPGLARYAGDADPRAGDPEPGITFDPGGTVAVR